MPRASVEEAGWTRPRTTTRTDSSSPTARRDRSPEMGAEEAVSMRPRTAEVARYLTQEVAATAAKARPRTAPSQDPARRTMVAATSWSRNDISRRGATTTAAAVGIPDPRGLGFDRFGGHPFRRFPVQPQQKFTLLEGKLNSHQDRTGQDRTGSCFMER